MTNIKKHIPTLAAILFVALGICATLYQNATKPEQYKTAYLDTFNTVTQFIGYSKDEETFREISDDLNDMLLEYHQLYDIYNLYDFPNLKSINDNAGIAPVKVDKKIIDLLKFSKELYQTTNGEINIAMGSVLEIWHYYRSFGREIPTMEELKTAAEHCDINDVIIDEEASTVYLADPEMSLDVGSIGKGYAVQMVAESARELGYTNLVINCGGNVITVGPKPDNSNWVFGIQNPDLEAENNMIQRVSITDKCLVTSGDYQRFYVVDGVEYCHIIDPDTLMPANYFSAVSIICDDSGLADALSTALFNMSYEDGLKLINSIENAEAIWIYEDGTIKYSNNFQKYIVK